MIREVFGLVAFTHDFHQAEEFEEAALKWGSTELLLYKCRYLTWPAMEEGNRNSIFLLREECRKMNLMLPFIIVCYRRLELRKFVDSLLLLTPGKGLVT